MLLGRIPCRISIAELTNKKIKKMAKKKKKIVIPTFRYINKRIHAVLISTIGYIKDMEHSQNLHFPFKYK